MEHVIEKYALENALKYEGKADAGAVIGSVIREVPDAKKDIKELKTLAKKIVSEVNKMNLEEQELRIREIAPELLEKEVEEKDIFSPFPVKGKVITAFPPEPSKYPHIGHAKSILVNHEFARRNNGAFILRFEDTNPELAKKDFYDIHLDNYRWLGVKPDRVENASDFMKQFYKYAEKLIESGDTYVCSCKPERVKKSRMKSKACEHRDRTSEENLSEWKKMHEKGKGSILRAKIDLEHKNSVMRDPTLFRIIDAEHALQGDKYRVWPTYDFENAVMDGLDDVTLRFRTKEFEMRTELQRYLQEKLDLPVTDTFEFARFELEGVETSGRVIREKVESGKLLGWDDPSLATLAALRRRGFQPKSIKDFVISTGLSKTEATLTWDDLILHNRRILDEEADRYFFVLNPKKITITGAPEQKIELHLHPEHRRGGRKMKTGHDFYISKNDYEKLEDGGFYRFMECLNFTKKGGFRFHSTGYEKYKDKGERIMHFLPVSDDLVEAEVLMPDHAVVKGLAEPGVRKLKEGDVIQFERFGFCRLDKSGIFWYTHK